MNFEKIVLDIISPLVNNKSSLAVRQMEMSNDKNILILVTSDKEDTAKLIGKKGLMADSIRELINVSAKLNNIRINLKFESYDEI